MLGLRLREEFLGTSAPQTAIELFKDDKTGAAQLDAARILDITYPTFDTRRALCSLNGKKPIVLIGERGQGKSHILAVVHHAIQSPTQVEEWAKSWTSRVEDDKFLKLVLPKGYFPITESMSNNEYSTLWNVLFDKHPRGQYFRGKFEQLNQPIPPKSLLTEMFSETPTVLILDEFQTWFEGLVEEVKLNGVLSKPRAWAFNFIQNLSELSKSIPAKFIFVVSVRNSSTEAYKQIHRDGPTLVDFSSTTAKEDRKRLILHRLFENRTNIAEPDIKKLTIDYIEERIRLLYDDKPSVDHVKLEKEVISCWPFAPELLNLMEDHILMGQAAQETRDLIKILAELYRERTNTPKSTIILTAADFYVDDDNCGVTSLLDSISSTGYQEKLREIAIRNLDAVKEANIGSEFVREIISSIWLRSLTQEIREVGGTDKELHLDITKGKKIDDNSFNVELTSIVEMSFNIHLNGKDSRFSFKEEENPATKLIAYAKNDKWFEGGTDKDYLADKVILNYLQPDSSATESPSRVIVLDQNWDSNPWQNKKDYEYPNNWNSQVLIVMPYGNTYPSEILGKWLKENVPVNRNMVRFLIPKQGKPAIYDDKDVIIPIRALIKAKEWSASDPNYRELEAKYKKQIEKLIDERFDRFAVLTNWDYQNPKTCKFEIDKHNAKGRNIPVEIEKLIRENIFAPEDFKRIVIEAANQSKTVGDVIKTLKDPPPKPEYDAIPYLGENVLYEQILRVVANSSNPRLTLNVRGNWFKREENHPDAIEAYEYLKRKAYASGKELYAVQLGYYQESSGGSIGVIEQPAEQPVSVNSPATGTPTATIGTKPDQTSTGGNTSDAPITFPQGEKQPTFSVQKTDAAKNGINLLGDLERWTQKVPTTEKLPIAKLEFDNLTTQEIKQILVKLPPQFKAKLEIVVPDGEE